MLTLVLQRSSP
ncbi:unnamed protein product [Linum tenue]|nr:unnamed protein product [Linum tenue]